MRRSLINRDNTLGRNVVGILASAILIPLALLLQLVLWPFARPLKRTPQEVVNYLQDFIEGRGGDWDWDDFVSIPIEDPRLESIREQARKFPESCDLNCLKELLREAELLETATPSGTPDPH